MRISGRSWLWAGAMVLSIFVANSFAAPTGATQYVMTNDDIPPFFSNGVSFFTVGAGGALTLKEQVSTVGSGTGGGYFASNRLAVLDTPSAQCVYASNAGAGDIVGIDISTLAIGGTASGSATDTGTSNGIGLAMDSQYLYASFSDVNTIGTFQVQPGCSLTFVNDISVAGLQAGSVTAMAINGNNLVVTYGDGSIESFNISSGTPVPNGDEQNSTAYLRTQGATYPNGIDITQDGHYVIFGDTSTDSVVEISDISSGKLSTTVSYTLGHTINSTNVMLSPDETLLYVSDTQGDRISAAYFNASTGTLSGTGCTSGRLKNYDTDWSYSASLGFASTTGTGSVVYIAEFGAPSSIAMVQVSSSGGKCTLTETAKSPITDTFSSTLLSIGTFPPRSF
jgi:6-phosphogluconolactonase (cycloisomerase 2 family)